jgi:hypothetical protein
VVERRLKPVPAPGPDTLGVMRKADGAPRDDTVLVRGCRRPEIYACGGCGAPLILYGPPTVVGDSLLLCNGCGTHNAPEAQG